MRFQLGAWAMIGGMAFVFSQLAAPAQTTVAWKAWTGAGPGNSWTTPGNWEGNTAPANDGTANVSFGPVTYPYVFVNASQSIKALKFDFSTATTFPDYWFSGATGTTLTIGSGGLTVLTPSVGVFTTGPSSPSVVSGAQPGSSPATSGLHAYLGFDSSLGIVLASDQTWNLGSASSTSLSLASNLSGPGRLTLTNGYVHLTGNNTYTGGTVLNNTEVNIATNTPFGTGPLTITGSSFLSVNGNYNAGDTPRTLGNALTLAGDLLTSTYGGTLTFTGPVTLAASVRLQNYGSTLFLNGNVGETGGPRKLSIATNDAIVLSGTSTYTGGTNVEYGALIFRNASSVPATNLLSAFWSGYLGVGFNTNVQSGFIDRFDKTAMMGTIGFDTDPAAATVTTFAGAVDLTGFNASVRLGSATRAILAGAITPSGAAYRFGGARGTLTVSSQLTGANQVSVQSDQGRELTLNLTNAANTYTGTTTALFSAVVFGPGALGAGALRTEQGGYIGTNDASLTPAAFIAKFDAASTTPMTTGLIGFDSAGAATARVITSAIDLRGFTAANTTIGLGTATAVTLAGAITLPAGQNAYYLSGYKGGQLTVNSTLAGTAGLQVGGIVDATGNVQVQYPARDPNDDTRLSTVMLNAANTFTGGTRLVSGRLVLGHPAALGTGPLIVDPGYYSNAQARIETSLATSPTFANPIAVRRDFELGGVNAFTLGGNITDGDISGYTGVITKNGTINVTLSGNNSGFTGGFNINEGTLTFAANTAAGTGPLWFGYYGSPPASATPTAAFTSPAPSITGLSAYSNSARLNLASGTTLTINESTDSFYAGQLQGAGGIDKTGSGTLRLQSASSSYTGPTKLSAGTLSVGATGALGSNTVTLNGPAKLSVDYGSTVNNPIAFGPAGGVLGGHGTFGSAVTLGANATVAPGNSVGLLTFSSGLTFGPGASYQVQVLDATGSAGSGWDFVNVTGSLNFTATLGAPMTIFLGSLTGGGAAGDAAHFVATNSYSWQIASASGGLTGFNPGAVVLNTGGFTNATGVGSFNVSASGNTLFVNFTPVPEPSTWALLVTGAGAMALGLRRRKRRSAGR